MKNNIELSQRLAHLESQLDATRSVTTKRTVSVASTTLEYQIPVIAPSNDVSPRASIQPGDVARVFQFEPVLKASRVYRRAKRDTTDYSFRSSIALSHAWTALSDMSLGDISIISVIALPVQSTDLANADRYEFTNWPLGSGEDNASQRPGSQGSVNTLRQSGRAGVTTPETLPSILESTLAPVSSYVPSNHVRLAVIGAPETDVNNLVARVRDSSCRFDNGNTNTAKFISPPYEPGDPQNIINEYEKSCTIDGTKTSLAVEAVTASSDAFNAGLHGWTFRRIQVFMLVYKSRSRESFDKVEDLIRQVKYYKDSFNVPPIMLVGTHDDETDERAVPEREGYELAKRYDISFREISESRVESLHDIFFQTVRQLWAFELQTYKPPPLRMLPSVPSVPLSKAKIESNNIVPKPRPRRLGFLRRVTETERLRMLRQPSLGAIQEV